MERTVAQDGFGKRVRDFRSGRNWTLEQMSGRVGITHAYLSEIERDIKEPSRPVRSAIERLMRGPGGDDEYAALAEFLPPEEVEMLKLWRKMPKTIRAYELAAMRRFLEDDQDA